VGPVQGRPEKEMQWFIKAAALLQGHGDQYVCLGNAVRLTGIRNRGRGRVWSCSRRLRGLQGQERASSRKVDVGEKIQTQSSAVPVRAMDGLIKRGLRGFMSESISATARPSARHWTGCAGRMAQGDVTDPPVDLWQQILGKSCTDPFPGCFRTRLNIGHLYPGCRPAVRENLWFR